MLDSCKLSGGCEEEKTVVTVYCLADRNLITLNFSQIATELQFISLDVC